MASIYELRQKRIVDALNDSLSRAESIDISTAFFYFTGFNQLAGELKDKKIRVLVGMTLEPSEISALNTALNSNRGEDFSGFEVKMYNSLSRVVKKKKYIDSFVGLFNRSFLSSEFDSTESQEAFKMFLSKLEDGSMEVRLAARVSHDKFYVMTNKAEYSADGEHKGEVYSGPCSFTLESLTRQAELDDRYTDNEKYDDYSVKFNAQWNDPDTVDICTKDTNEAFLKEIEGRLWMFSHPDPYKIYVRILHELFSTDDESEFETPYSISRRYADYKYQIDAIKYGLACIKKNSGVIIADVVGLGKSVIAAAIAYNLNYRRIVIISPPHLVDMWEDYQQEFSLRGVKVYSSGKIDEAYRQYADDRDPILYIIDEAHRYRNENTENYMLLHKLTRSNAENKVILMTATPYNNRPQDIFALVKLFQTPSRSTINTADNLGMRFRELIIRYKSLEKEWKSNGEDAKIRGELSDLSRQLRDLISPVIIRRSRIDLNEIKEYSEDLKLQKIQLPKVVGPELEEYDLGKIRPLYLNTLKTISENFKGARYNPTDYLSDRNKFDEQYGKIFGRLDIIIQAQRNIASYMKRLLVKRFESSKDAFRRTVESLMEIYDNIIKWWEKGYVPIQKKGYIDDPEEIDIEELVEGIDSTLKEDTDLTKLRKHAIPIDRSFFVSDYIEDVKKEREILKRIHEEWFEFEDIPDPKYEMVSDKIGSLLDKSPARKIVIFTEYADTAKSVYTRLTGDGYRCFLYTGSSSKRDHDVVRENFDAAIPVKMQKNDYDIIVATDALSEGFNLNRAGVVFNYDIPYNPTRVVQRIGRINRINKKMFDHLYIYNFFPTDIGEENTSIKGISTLKMLLINQIVGSDTRTLTPDEDLQSYFKSVYETAERGNDEKSWDVEYRNVYNSVKNDRNLMNEVLNIPERVKIIRRGESYDNSIVTFAMRGDTCMFVKSNELGGTENISPENALGYFKSEPDDKSFESDDALNNVFTAIRNKVYESDRLVKMEGNKIKAKENLSILSKFCPEERGYLHDLMDVITMYDDLCDGELKFLAGFRLSPNNVKKTCDEIKANIPEHYIEQIIDKARSIDSRYEIIMFTEGLRNDKGE